MRGFVKDPLILVSSDFQQDAHINANIGLISCMQLPSSSEEDSLLRGLCRQPIKIDSIGSIARPLQCV